MYAINQRNLSDVRQNQPPKPIRTYFGAHCRISAKRARTGCEHKKLVRSTRRQEAVTNALKKPLRRIEDLTNRPNWMRS